MKIFKWTAVSLILISSVLFFYCKTEKKPEEEKGSEMVDYTPLLLGNWELAKAYRNKEEIVSLDNTMFQFGADGSIISNFNAKSESQTNTYIVDKDVIKQTGMSSFTYLIQSVTDSTLVLTTRYRGYDFQLELTKWELEGEPQ